MMSSSSQHFNSCPQVPSFCKDDEENVGARGGKRQTAPQVSAVSQLELEDISEDERVEVETSVMGLNRSLGEGGDKMTLELTKQEGNVEAPEQRNSQYLWAEEVDREIPLQSATIAPRWEVEDISNDSARGES